MRVIHAETVTASVQGAATLWAAVIAGGAAILSAVLSAIAAHGSGRWTQREQWWQRFAWACERSTNPDPGQSEVGISVLTALISVPWASDDDSEMAVAVGNAIVTRVRATRSGDGGRARRILRRWSLA